MWSYATKKTNKQTKIKTLKKVLECTCVSREVHRFFIFHETWQLHLFAVDVKKNLDISNVSCLTLLDNLLLGKSRRHPSRQTTLFAIVYNNQMCCRLFPMCEINFLLWHYILIHRSCHCTTHYKQGKTTSCEIPQKMLTVCRLISKYSNKTHISFCNISYNIIPIKIESFTSSRKQQQ